jgi:cytochrome P450
VPGPWLSRVTRLPLLYATLKLQRTAYADDLIRKYGPLVVLAPDQVHTNDQEAMKIIYDRTSTKSHFYEGMGTWKGVTVTLGFKTYHEAAPSRNYLIQCFQNRNLAILVENLETHCQRFVDVLKKKSKFGESTDGVYWFRLLALDIVTDVLWGEEKSLLLNTGNSGEAFLRRFHAFSKWNALKSFIPGADFYVRNFGSLEWKTLRNDCSDMDVSARDALERWKNRGEQSHDRDVLSMLLGMGGQDKSWTVPIDHMPAYMVEMMAAGSSTSSHTAAFICWALMRHPEAQKTLRKELFEASPDINALDLKNAQTLPYLEAVVKETMRLWPMIPGPLERHLGKSITVNGMTVPPGVIASTSAYTQGRLESVYPNAGEFCPGRWLNESEDMKINWIPFGTGSRACPGSNLVLTELRYIVHM